MTRSFSKHLLFLLVVLLVFFLGNRNKCANALDDDESQIEPFEGWKAIEIITEGDSRGGSEWEMPDDFDGAGAFLLTDEVIRIHVNHEKGESSISEINVDKAILMQAISNKIENDHTCGLEFVKSAQIAYERWSEDGGKTNDTDVDPDETEFCRFCSSQEYAPNTFGKNKGFVDQLYITGEECDDGRLFVLDSINRMLYVLSGVTGSSNTERGGMPFGPWENAALLDTGETEYIALFLSPDGRGDTEIMKLYVGHKNKNTTGHKAFDFLSRNGLAYGEYYHLIADFPDDTGNTNNGTFDKDTDDGLGDGKNADIDTDPSNPTRVVFAESKTGIFILDFNLHFDEGGFNSTLSNFTIQSIPIGDIEDPDNVEWSANGDIFVNEDSDDGAVWQMKADGSNRTKIGETTDDAESSGIFDFSEFVDYPPGQILVTTSMGSPSSMSILISPEADPIIPAEDCPSAAPTVAASEEPSAMSSEDDDLSAGSAAAMPPQGAEVFEAEDAVLVKARVETIYAPFSGTGYADMMGPDASLQWDATDLASGQYEVSVSYASGSDRPAYLVVDGTRLGEFQFRETPSWLDWTVETKTILLAQGDHSFKISAEQSSGPNIDWLALRPIVGVVPPARTESDGSSIYEAEDGTCEFCKVETTHPGFTGSGYVDFSSSEAYLEWAIGIGETATYNVVIRYASASNRPADLVVDGGQIADLLFETTNGWRNWETETVDILSLSEGVHTLRIDCGQKSSGPNVDWIAVRKSS